MPSPYTRQPTFYSQQRAVEQTRVKYGVPPAGQDYLRLLGDMGELSPHNQRMAQLIDIGVPVGPLGRMTIFAYFFSASPFFTGVERVYAVKSSFIHSLIYRRKQRQLFILMRGGKTYIYNGVTLDLFTRMLNDISKGRFYNFFIRGKYGKAQRIL